MRQLSLVLWNTQWRRRVSLDGAELGNRILNCGPDVVVLTEAHTGFLGGGHELTSEANYGYPLRNGRRMVVLWSRRPWRAVDAYGSADFPPGRFVTGITETNLGPVCVVGVCIPWPGSHVRDGHRNRKTWEAHLAYLGAIERYLESLPQMSTIVAGDFNQGYPARMGKDRRDAAELMAQVFGGWIKIRTGTAIGSPPSSIDHIALSQDLACDWRPLSNVAESGRALSDRSGIVSTITFR